MKVDPLPEYPSVKVGGFFHLDWGNFNQDAASVATLGSIQDGVGFRRARLQAAGNVARATSYEIEMDFATAGRPSFMDVWVEQSDLPLFNHVRIGQFRQPFCLDAMTSIRELDFLERALPFQAFVPFRRVGVMSYDNSADERTTWAYSGYKTGGFINQPLGDDRFATDIGDGGGYSLSSRLTHLLYYDESCPGRSLLHLGGGYNYSVTTGNIYNPSFSKIYQARALPEFFVGEPTVLGLTTSGTPFFVDTGRVRANAFHLFGVEMIWQQGPVHVQGEYMATVVDQLFGPNLFYDGAYLQLGWFLTGEHRNYNRMWGALDRVTPCREFQSSGRCGGICGWGAWEASLRWSYVNLNDPGAIPVFFLVGPPPEPDPGRLQNLTLGLTWVLNSFTKLQFNWIHAFLDNAQVGDSNTDIFALRAQVGF